MATERRCRECRKWYRASADECSYCGASRFEHGRYDYLRSVKAARRRELDRHLYRQAHESQPKVQFQKLREGFRKTMERGA